MTLPEFLDNLMDTMGIVLTKHPLTAAETCEAVELLPTGFEKTARAGGPR